MESSTVNTFNLQPVHLADEMIRLVPLGKDDFEKLYKVASDPLIWEQHPTRNRYQRDVFEIFFKGAIESGSAFLVLDAKTGEPIGSTRFYDHNEAERTVTIGYSFVARRCWGKGYNESMKMLMINYAFQFVDHILFHIGASNIRSQKAIAKFGAKKIDEQMIVYAGEPQGNMNYIYRIDKEGWKG